MFRFACAGGIYYRKRRATLLCYEQYATFAAHLLLCDEAGPLRFPERSPPFPTPRDRVAGVEASGLGARSGGLGCVVRAS
ncbi:hypothetical protein PMIN01_04461 [Paraphaeosphaeria minitans]|uniref:Uncharacterized protein n=1 Tax=Paraphaeosphaeria minitans TaxID=565426 RepID=A0A9P6GJ43_9PLEO|nr:hypothetical protein PMIN01_04461 [Paraphaeosphaeria minitans]